MTGSAIPASIIFAPLAEMDQLFADIPEAISNSLMIAKRCSVMAEERAPILPVFTRDEGRSESEELGFSGACWAVGAAERHVYGPHMDAGA